ncbi:MULTISPECIES: hypothetical protein [unclassified Guyparkeria]|uniref:hypothetical protein n=1 Tax=unclassified Guyparkeria TaxID=2626246 RepID=UPI00073362CC|nr:MULTISPECIES: hypothetical protein [unclassified Guyparkeria]KTG16138.1 hypothetical protein AUR63_04680 [Guyparkeria sp. XI15]OAE84989.1 hypothetical protein AWR35_04690 [Guyparkeria sp. WRN-7]
MFRRIYNALTIVALLFIAAVMVLVVAPSFLDPQFEIRNRTEEPVSAVAAWREQERAFPNIGPDSTIQFSVEDEAGMAFRVRYPDGREAACEPVYFTRGTTVIATITEDDIEVRYDRDI